MGDIEEFNPDYTLMQQLRINLENLSYHLLHPLDPPKIETTVIKQITDTKDLNKELYISYEALQAQIISLQKKIQDYERAGKLTEVVDIKKELAKTIKNQREYYEGFRELSILDLTAWADSGLIRVNSKDGVPLGTLIDIRSFSDKDGTQWILVLRDFEGNEKRFLSWTLEGIFHHYETLSMQLNGGVVAINWYGTGEHVQDQMLENPNTMKREHVDKVIKELQQNVNAANQRAKEATWKYKETLAEKDNKQDELDTEKVVSKAHLKTVQNFKEVAMDAVEGMNKMVRETTGNLTSRVVAEKRQRTQAEAIDSLLDRVNQFESISHNEANQKLLGEHSEVVGDIQDRAIKMIKATPPVSHQMQGKGKQMIEETTTEEAVPAEEGEQQ